MRRRLINAYISSIISISLVLMLVGFASLLLVNARNVADYFKESMQLSVIMKNAATDEDAVLYQKHIEKFPSIRSTRLITREQGTEEMKEMLGEDFLDVFETSPVPVSIEISLQPEYVSADSLDVVQRQLADSPLVEEVSCQRSLVEALNRNLTKISSIILVFVLLLLFISFVLINNTVRLNVYNRRFTVHTMKLVGATKAFIRKPFLTGALVQGIIASFVAIVFLALILLYLKNSFAQLFGIFTPQTLAISAIVVISCGIAICVISTYFVVGKLISLNKDKLYY